MTTDFKSTVLEEIALEGLDGITVSCLWTRLKGVARFPLALDDHSKQYIWRCLIGHEDLEFYELPEPRPLLVPYNVFHYIDPETNHIIESEHVPVDPYPIKVINEQGVMGSCATFHTRRNITEEVCGKDGTPVELEAAHQRWGERLVIVASQLFRTRTLMGSNSDPNTVFMPTAYAILERIGRSRHSGEMSTGRMSLQVFNEKPKSMFYYCKRLSKQGFVIKQTVIVESAVIKKRNNCKLLHLTRFYKEITSMHSIKFRKVINILRAKPEKYELVSVIKSGLDLSDKSWKRILQAQNSFKDRFMETIDVPYRKIHPDSTPQEYLVKTGARERYLRCVKLVLDPFKDEKDEDADEANSDSEDEEVGDDEDFPPFERVFGKTLLAQALEYIKKVGHRGIAQSELKRALNLDRLEARMLIKNLIRMGLIVHLVKDRGRQKTTVFMVPEMRECYSQSHRESLTAGYKKLAVKAVETPAKREVDEPGPSEEGDTSAGPEFAEFEVDKQKKKGQSVPTPVAKVIVEQVVEVEKKQNRHSFIPGTDAMFTALHFKRKDHILEAVRKAKLADNYTILKEIRLKEREEGHPYMLDKKSFMRIVYKLVKEKELRSLKTVLQLGDELKEIHFLCDASVSPTDPIVKSAIERAKFQYFHVKKEDLKKVAKYEKRKEKTDKEKKQAIKLEDGIPETARESILKVQEYRKRPPPNLPKMKYNRTIGVKYGALPKMKKLQLCHQIVWYLCYDRYGMEVKKSQQTLEVIGELSQEEKEDAGVSLKQRGFSAEKIEMAEPADEHPLPDPEVWKDLPKPVVYMEEMSWKRYMEPLTVHTGYGPGWCFVGDLLIKLPLVVFCQILNITYEIDGLELILEHPDKKFYPVQNLPFKFAQQLMFSKKYIHSFYDLALALCHMGLVSFGNRNFKLKDQMFLYVHKNATVMDTRTSLPGYSKVSAPEGETFIEKVYRLTDLDSVNAFWEDLHIIAIGSNVGRLSLKETDTHDTASYEVLSLNEAEEPKTPETVSDTGVVPGDRRGAAGFDSSLFVHRTTNWSSQMYFGRDRQRWKSYSRNFPMVERPESAAIRPTRRDRSGEVNVHKRLPRLNSRKPSLDPSEIPKSAEIKKTVTYRGNKGGKGISKINRRKRRIPVQNVDEPKAKRRAIADSIAKKKRWKRKGPHEKGDEKDRTIYRQRTKQRVNWSTDEDSILLLCIIANKIMLRNRKILNISRLAVRDALQRHCPGVSVDKSSDCCSRRMKFVMKHPQTLQNVSVFEQEALHDPLILKEFANKNYFLQDPATIQKFHELVQILCKKFKLEDHVVPDFPSSLTELKEFSMEQIFDENSRPHQRPNFSDVTSRREICRDVLKNIIHSAVVVNDKQGRAHEMYRLLTQYPEALLSEVVKTLRDEGLLVMNKNMSGKKLQAGLGMAGFKASQRYFYSYKKFRGQGVLFEDTADMVQTLYDVGGQGLHRIEKASISDCLATLTVMSHNLIRFHGIMPEELVKVDKEYAGLLPGIRGRQRQAVDTKKPVLPSGSREALYVHTTSLKEKLKAREQKLSSEPSTSTQVDAFQSLLLSNITTSVSNGDTGGAEDVSDVEKGTGDDEVKEGSKEDVDKSKEKKEEGDGIIGKGKKEEDEIKEKDQEGEVIENKGEKCALQEEGKEEYQEREEEGDEISGKNKKDENEMKEKDKEDEVRGKDGEDVQEESRGDYQVREEEGNEINGKSKEDKDEMEKYMEGEVTEKDREENVLQEEDRGDCGKLQETDMRDREVMDAVEIRDDGGQEGEDKVKKKDKEGEVGGKDREEDVLEEKGRKELQETDRRDGTKVIDAIEIRDNGGQEPLRRGELPAEISAREIKSSEQVEHMEVDTCGPQLDVSLSEADSDAVPDQSFVSDSVRYGTDPESSSSETVDSSWKSVTTGSSKIVFEGLRTDRKKYDVEVPATFASRTLLSLRRSGTVSVEDISIFNAQDNFVVNACKVSIGLKTDAGLEISEGDSVEGETRKGTETTETRVQDLLPQHELYKEIVRRLQWNYPFQLEMSQVWQNLSESGMPTEQIALCKEVFNVILHSKDLGIRVFDLKKQFQSGSELLHILKLLVGQQAVLQVGVTDIRYVSFQYARPWLIHAYKNLKGRGVHLDEDKGQEKVLDGTTEVRAEYHQDIEACSGAVTSSSHKATETATPSKRTRLDEVDHTSTEMAPTYSKGGNTETDSVDLSVLETGPSNRDGEENQPKDMDIADIDPTQSSGLQSETEPAAEVVSSPRVGSNIQTESLHISTATTSQGEQSQTESVNTVSKGLEETRNVDCQDSSLLCIDTEAFQGQTSSATEELSSVAASSGTKQTIDQDKSSSATSLTSNKGDKSDRKDSSVKGDDSKEQDEPIHFTRSSKRDRKRRHLGEETSQSAAPSKSTYDKVRLLCQPYKKPEGSINKPVLKMMLESIVTHLMIKPGCPETALFQRFAPYLQPMTVRRLLEILEDIGCVKKEVFRSTKPTLFSRPSLPVRVTAADADEGDCVVYNPTVNCVLKIGQFSQTVFPGVEWPKLEDR